MSIDHPAVLAVRQAKHRLYQAMSPAPGRPSATQQPDDDEAVTRLIPAFRQGEVEQLLRVEYSREEEGAVLHAFNQRSALARFYADKVPGPLTIEGVAWYLVPYLPAPGWRVINPLGAR